MDQRPAGTYNNERKKYTPQIILILTGHGFHLRAPDSPNKIFNFASTFIHQNLVLHLMKISKIFKDTLINTFVIPLIPLFWNCWSCLLLVSKSGLNPYSATTNFLYSPLKKPAEFLLANTFLHLTLGCVLALDFVIRGTGSDLL